MGRGLAGERLIVVVDTGPLVAAASRRDVAHRLASRILTEHEGVISVPDPVLVEADIVIRRRGHPEAARRLHDDVLAGRLRRIAVTDALYRRALDYDRTYADLGLGLVDATVKACSDGPRIPIFTFDFAHFRATKPSRGDFWRLLVAEDSFRRLTGRPAPG